LVLLVNIEVADDAIEKRRGDRALDSLDELDERLVEGDAVLGHGGHDVPPHEVGVLDRAYACPEAPPDALERYRRELLARGLAHLVDPVGDHRHDRERAHVTTGVVELSGRAKIRLPSVWVSARPE
jgi:hypothetical protein